MTIDDCIKELLINKEDDTYVLGNETIDFAIDIMRKYQKINEIVKNTDRNADTVRNALAFGDIAKVVEDGKND